MIEQMFPNAGVVISFFIGLISIFASGYAVATSRTKYVKTEDCKERHDKQDVDCKDKNKEGRLRSDKEISALHEKINEIAVAVGRIDERTMIILDNKKE